MDGQLLAELLARYRSRGDLLVLLKETQAAFGGLTPGVLSALAEGLAMPAGDLYGIVSFYSFLSTAPVGRHTIKLCRSVPCGLAHAGTLRAAVEAALGIKPGETTADGRFTLELTNCIGACGRAPALMIDEQRLDSQTAASAVLALAAVE